MCLGRLKATGCLHLGSCGHSFHVQCLLWALQGQARGEHRSSRGGEHRSSRGSPAGTGMPAHTLLAPSLHPRAGKARWLCPSCRTDIDPAAVQPVSALSSAAVGRHFFVPQVAPSARAVGPLTAVCSFAAAAGRALEEGGSTAAALTTAPAFNLAPLLDSLMPRVAADTTTTVLASLCVQRLLHPTKRSSLLPAAAFCGVGVLAGVAALACLMSYGLAALCHTSAAVADQLGEWRHDCALDGSGRLSALRIVACVEALGICACLALLAASHDPHSLAQLLLQLDHADRHGLARLLLRAYFFALLLAAAVLGLAFMASVVVSAAGWLLGRAADALG